VKDREFSPKELSRLSQIVGDDPVEAVAEVSHGPWWGFNGVQTLVLTASRLYRVQGGFALRKDRVLESTLRSQVTNVDWVAGSQVGRSLDVRPSRQAAFIHLLAGATPEDLRPPLAP
jgi:hypothetical protein